MTAISNLYQKTADTLRKAAFEKLGPRDPAHRLLQLAANQLENAADTARLLEQTLERKGEIIMVDHKPSNGGQWQAERDAEVRSAFRQGAVIGALVMAGLWMAIKVLA